MKKTIFILTTILLVNIANAQEEKIKKWELTGYITNMQSVQFDSIKKNWLNDNLIHNRLNFSWFVNEKLTFEIGVRNRLMTGESIKLIPNYADMLENGEQGLVDMNWNLIDEQSVIFNTNIDRLFFQYEADAFSLIIGRQRINWGKTFAWNPNDLFNAYSFFDFDYPEKPGSDAIRLQYYTGMASSIEVAVKANKEEEITAAALWRFNKWKYDFQLMAGMLDEKDYALGGGWSGAIKSLDFKGEFTYLHPMDNINDTTGQFIASLSTGYYFKNSLNFQLEFLYSDIPEGGISSFEQYYYQALTVKNLSFAEYNLFAQVGFQITPLLKTSLSGMYYPKLNGYFLGPTFDYSFTDNLYLSFVVQTFSAEFEDPITSVKARKNATFAYLRLKWNF